MEDSDRLNEILLRLKSIETKLGHLEVVSYKMSDHITFIESVYATLERPLEIFKFILMSPLFVWDRLSFASRRLPGIPNRPTLILEDL